jgi:signal transduction histidine kinase
VDFGADLASVPEITLDHTENFFSFEFAALDFAEPSKNQYAYRLEGFDRTWFRCGTRRYASYTNIGGGEYIFRVRASNNDGVWNREGASIRIRIRPPFYAAGWFQALAGFLVAGVLLGGYQLRIRRVLARQRELAELVTERTRQLEAKNVALAARRDELETIDKIVSSINAGIQFGDVLSAIVRETAIIPGAERASFLVLDRAAGVFRFQALRGWPEGARQKAALPPEEAGHRFLAGAEEIFPDIFLAQARPDQPPSDADTFGGRIRSRLTLRIPVNGRVEGYLLLENQIDPAAFAHADTLLLRSLKEHIQAAFIKARILDELRLLNEKKNEFLGLAAHDLRNPLNTVINRVGLLQRQVREGRYGPGSTADDLESVLRAAEHMQTLINELLDLSAIESGRLTLCRKPESVSALLLESGAFYRRIAEQKNIRLEVDTGPELPPVPMDKARIMEVMDNLLSNAIKFTYPGGSIRVWPEPAERAVRIHVTDTGQGLDESDLRDVFTGFKKLSARPTGGESSTGLGLAIVKKIVEAHGGSVGVRSRKGEGAVFTVSLPRTEEKCGACPSRGPECGSKP